MPIYSHSQLSTYEQCPLRYRLSYRDRIKRDTEGIEAFLGSRVHETLKKAYDDARLTKVNALPELLSYYETVWEQNWRDGVVVTRKDVTLQHYKALGKKMIETYHARYAPFSSDTTIDTEMRVVFSLDGEGKYQLQGFIDRLSRTGDGVYHIHDYKTSAHLPGQSDADSDRQLALYHIGVKKRWPDVQQVRLVWHYLAFDRELVSVRSDDALDELATGARKLIDDIEAAADFPPRESSLCQWCEYPDLCPNRKHLYMVESLPVNQYLKEPGVLLVNRYAELKDKAKEIETETELVREAIVDYAKREYVTAIRGSGRQVRIKFDKKLKFPGKNEEGREHLVNTVIGAGKWMDVSQLDTTALAHAVEDGLWDKKLIAEVMKHGRTEESSTVWLSRPKGEE